MGYMIAESISAHKGGGDLFELILQFALATAEEVEEARVVALGTDRHPDDILVASGIVDRMMLLRLMASAWLLPTIDLAKERADRDLIAEWSPDAYLRDNWLPVRDKANGAVLIATARKPDAAGAARITDIVECPVEFAVTTAYDIRITLERATRARRMLSFPR